MSRCHIDVGLAGTQVRLFADKAPCGGKTLDLVGTGAPEEMGDLGALEDAASCAQSLPP